MVESQRVRVIHDVPARRGRYVLYWMQQSQRTRFNHALEYAVARANELRLPVLVGFGLMDDYPEANARHYAFMLQGLAEVKRNLSARGIGFVIMRGSPANVAVRLAKDAAAVVCDRGYLRHQKRWRDDVADRAGARVVEVESDVVVPVETASGKAEYGARTIRPKIRRHLASFLTPVKAERPRVKWGEAGTKLADEVDLSDIPAALRKLKLDHSVAPSPLFVGGEDSARAMLRRFLDRRLARYGQDRNEPSLDGTSRLAAYLHFGQISPLEIALAALDQKDAPEADREAYVEELVVRRELAMNFVYYTPNYDSYGCLPAWARKTLAEHRNDERYHVYTREELEAAETHDAYWNAAQREINRSGFMHNYMRMYWGKKILEWSRTPEEAYEATLGLNNKLFLCGRDANAYANVGWIFGLHDRAWGPERPVFGKVRYMNAAGLKRKFDMDGYMRKVEAMGG